MRRTCQVWTMESQWAKQCGKPAVDFAEIAGMDLSRLANAYDTVRVWMCALHWDEHKQRKSEG